MISVHAHLYCREYPCQRDGRFGSKFPDLRCAASQLCAEFHAAAHRTVLCERQCALRRRSTVLCCSCDLDSIGYACRCPDGIPYALYAVVQGFAALVDVVACFGGLKCVVAQNCRRYAAGAGRFLPSGQEGRSVREQPFQTVLYRLDDGFSDFLAVEALCECACEGFSDAHAVCGYAAYVNAQKPHDAVMEGCPQSCAHALCDASQPCLACAVPPLGERLHDDFVPRQLDFLPQGTGVFPLWASCQFLYGCYNAVNLPGDEVYRFSDCVLDVRHMRRHPFHQPLSVRLQFLSDGDFHALGCALEKGKGASQIVQLNICHVLRCALCVADCVCQFIVPICAGAKQGFHRFEVGLVEYLIQCLCLCFA